MQKRIIILTDRKFRKTDFTGLAYSYMRAFQKRGFECDLVSLNIDPYLFPILNKLDPDLATKYVKVKQKSILKFIANSDKKFVFVIKGYYLLPSTIEEIKSLNKKVFCFYPDDPLIMHSGTSNKFVLESIGKYNAYFIWSKNLVNKLIRNHCKHTFYLPFCADTDLLKCLENNLTNNGSKMHADVSFVGNGDKERTEFLNSLSFCLSKDFNKIVYGSHWEKIDGFEVKKIVIGQDFINAIFYSKINLNILRVQNKNSNNMRTFEIPAVGSFMLHEYSEEAMEFFVPGIEADYFKSPEECANKIKFYLKNESLRLKIARAGHEKIFSAKYLYTDRVEEIWEKVLSVDKN